MRAPALEYWYSGTDRTRAQPHHRCSLHLVEGAGQRGEEGPILKRSEPSPRTHVFGVRLPFYGWAVVAVGTLIAFCSGPGQSYVFSVFIDPIIQDTGISRTQISTLYAIGTGVSALMVMVVSRAADRFGPRLIVALIAAALGIACFGMSLATGALGILIGFAALRALGQGSMPINATLLAAQWFVRYRGRAMAIIGLGFAASNALLPPLSRLLIEQIGWRGAYMVLGVMVWILIIPAALFIVRNQPEDLGLYPDGDSAPPRSEQRGPGGVGEEPRPVKVFSSLKFWLLAVPLAAPSFITTALVFHQASIFLEHGLSPAVAASVFVPYAIMSAGASTLAGFVADRIGPKRLFLINLGILFIAIVILYFINSPATAVLYAAILGAAGGTQSVVTGVTWAHYYGRRGLGRVQGSASMILISGAAIGPLPIAELYDLTGGYTAGLVLMAAMVMICWVVAAVYRPMPADASAPA